MTIYTNGLVPEKYMLCYSPWRGKFSNYSLVPLCQTIEVLTHRSYELQVFLWKYSYTLFHLYPESALKY